MLKLKAILFDVDGVLVKYRCNFTSALAERGYTDAPRIMQSYYHQDNTALYNQGCATEEELVGPYLEQLGWKGSAQDYLDAQCAFAREHLDGELVAHIQEIRAGGIACFIATNQGPYQARFLLEEMDFDNLFDGHYISCSLGFRKEAAPFWESVLQDLEVEQGVVGPWEVAYFDDQPKNVDVASGCGIQSFLFTGNIQLENDLRLLGLDITLNRYF